MLLKFINYLRSKLPKDEVLGPWIDEIQTQGENIPSEDSAPELPNDLSEDDTTNRVEND